MDTVEQLLDDWMELFAARMAASTIKTRTFRAKLKALDDRFLALSFQEQDEYTCKLGRRIRAELGAKLSRRTRGELNPST